MQFEEVGLRKDGACYGFCLGIVGPQSVIATVGTSRLAFLFPYYQEAKYGL